MASQPMDADSCAVAAKKLDQQSGQDVSLPDAPKETDSLDSLKLPSSTRGRSETKKTLEQTLEQVRATREAIIADLGIFKGRGCQLVPGDGICRTSWDRRYDELNSDHALVNSPLSTENATPRS